MLLIERTPTCSKRSRNHAGDGPTVTAITHRKDPIFQGLLTGKPVTENHILKQVPFEASVFRALKRQFPTIQAVSVRASCAREARKSSPP